MTDQEIENEIQEKGLTATRVTLELIESEIDREIYTPVVGTNVIIAVLVLRNGYSVIGHSACVSDVNFDYELGKKIARQHAIDQCWALFGFRLASQLSEK